jgi:hypothetical protein
MPPPFPPAGHRSEFGLGGRLDAMWEALGIIPVLFVVLLVLVSILVFLIPFFILKIRNQVVQINQKMDRIIDLLGSSGGKRPHPPTA